MSRKRDELDRLIVEETEAAEQAHAADLGREAAGIPAGLPAGKRRRPVRETTLTIRLTSVERSALERYADRAGVPASALAREWIWERLNSGSGEPVRDTLARLREDVDRLERQLALCVLRSADDALADRAQDEHGEVDQAADDHDHAEQESGERRPGRVQRGSGARVHARPGQ
jgi:hypothetical protein